MRDQRCEGLSEEEISCPKTRPGECPYCKTNLTAVRLGCGRSVRKCGFDRCIYLRDSGRSYGEDEPVQFHCIRKKDDHGLYWSYQREWTNNFLGAAILTPRQSEDFVLPKGGELHAFIPGDIEDGGTTWSTIEIPEGKR